MGVGKHPRARRIASASLPTAHANFTVHAFRDQVSGCEHLALVLGAVDDGRPVLTRIHSECLTGDSLMSPRFDCGDQLQTAIRRCHLLTKNLRAVQLLLGHTRLESTVRYLGIEVDDALEIAEQTEV
jgi:GTP cyclohydrolase II